MELDSSAACFACNNMRVSASSCVVNNVSTSLEASLVIKHLLSHVTFCQSIVKNLIKFVLLLDDDKIHLHCFILWPATMLPKRRPLSDPRLTRLNRITLS